jgi:CheY-like chemotaxis protein
VIYSLSAQTAAGQAARGRAAGVDGFLSKPLDIEQLAEVVAAVGGEARAQIGPRPEVQA